MSSTIATVTATATVTQVITVTAAPTFAFFDTCWSTLMTVNVTLLLLSLVVVGLLGISTLSIFPVILPICFALGNGLCYYAFVSKQYSIHAREIAAAFTYIFWSIGSFLLPFYSFVILERILQRGERRFFLSVFIFLSIISIGARIPDTISGVLLVRRPNDKRLQHMHNSSALATFVILAFTELFNAFFLVKTFHQSRKIAVSAGRPRSERLMKQLCLSTEIRLIGIAIPGILRACVYPFVPYRTSGTRTTAAGLDRFGAVLENVFPVVLMIDLLVTKYWGLASRKSSSKQSGILMGQGFAAAAAVARNERKKRLRPEYWKQKAKDVSSENPIREDSALSGSQTMGSSETGTLQATHSAYTRAENIGPLDEDLERDPIHTV